MNRPIEEPLRYLNPSKFRDPDRTAEGAVRARVRLETLKCLWFNTGTLCNLACTGCYIESSPTNDRLAYLTTAEVVGYLDEIEAAGLGTEEIGFTGGEPFMNRDLVDMLAAALGRGLRVLVLTNAMRPMMKCAEALLGLRASHGDRLTLRVSLDHYEPKVHEFLRGPRSWDKALAGLRWLSDNGFTVHVAARTCWPETEDELRAGFGRLFRAHGIRIDPADPVALLLFPEMDAQLDVPEISEQCWGLLGVAPQSIMCASSRMVAKRKGAARPVVLSCTILPYDEAFEFGPSLADGLGEIRLNHPHCARFCVFGGGACGQ